MAYPTASQNTTANSAHKTQFCGDLRSKKFYMLGRLPVNEEDFIDASNHCWCYHTQSPMGPDGGLLSLPAAGAIADVIARHWLM